MPPDYDYNYVFRFPIASSIHPQAPGMDETFSTVHENLTYDKVHSTWTSVTQNIEAWGSIPQDGLKFDKIKKTYLCTPGRYYFDITPEEEKQGHIGFFVTASSADFLYRLRCFFPDIHIQSLGPEGYKAVWNAGLKHRQSGVILEFTEHKAGLSVYVARGSCTINMSDAGSNFTPDVIELMNAFFATVDGSRRIAYFHPAANADFPGPDEHYLAVPSESLRKRIDEYEGKIESLEPYSSWNPTNITSEDFSSKSILPSMKYNIVSRKVDTINGSADLTTIISSSLLFYRLLCHFVCDDNNANNAPPITSVWQVKLQHKVNHSSILFMDNHGLFDIRATENVKEVMDDIISLVNELFSDECCHPYDGVVAGCVA